MITSVLILAAQIVPMVIPEERTPETQTLMASSYDCDLSHENGARVKFGMKVSGGRAFVHDNRIARTPINVSVSDDSTGVFSKYRLESWDGSSVQGRANQPGALFGDWFALTIEPARDELKPGVVGRAAMMVGEFRAPDYGMKPIYVALGFCDAIISKQTPLSAAEAQKALINE